MEPHAPRSFVGTQYAVLLVAPCLLLTGCVTWPALLRPDALPPRAPVCQVMATWNPEVVFVPDPANGGVPRPGLAGRMYLFGPEIKHPVAGDGAVVVSLYDDAPLAQGKPAVQLEEWRIDKDTLKRLLCRDFMGWGYTLFLPWGSYRPDITQVHLRLRYDPPGRAPLYSEGSSFVVNRSNPNGIHVANKPSMPRG